MVAQHNPRKLGGKIRPGQLVAAVLGDGIIIRQVDHKVGRARVQQLPVAQPCAAGNRFEQIHHNAGGLPFVIQIGVGDAVGADQHGKDPARGVLRDDVVFLGGGQVDVGAGAAAVVVFVKQGAAPAGVIAVHFDQGIVDKQLRGNIVLAHRNVDILQIKGVNDPFVGGRTQPVGDGDGDKAGLQRVGKLQVGVKVDRRAGEVMLPRVGKKALVAAVAAAGHTNGHTVKGIVVAGGYGAVAGPDGQHGGHAADRLGGEGEALIALFSPAQHRDQVDLTVFQHLHSLRGVAVIAQIFKLYVLTLADALQHIIRIAAAVAVRVHHVVAGVGVIPNAYGAQGLTVIACGLHRHGKAQHGGQQAEKQQQRRCAPGRGGGLLLIHGEKTTP